MGYRDSLRQQVNGLPSAGTCERMEQSSNSERGGQRADAPARTVECSSVPGQEAKTGPGTD